LGGGVVVSGVIGMRLLKFPFQLFYGLFHQID
jgi:hypothetical protein